MFNKSDNQNYIIILSLMTLVICLMLLSSDRFDPVPDANATVSYIPDVKWEYKSIVASYNNMEILNKFGKEGWELVAVTGESVTKAFFFKRQLKLGVSM